MIPLPHTCRGRFDGTPPSVASVMDLTTGDSVDFKRDPITQTFSFTIQSGPDYEVTTAKPPKLHNP